jgi:hypothetical protein
MKSFLPSLLLIFTVANCFSQEDKSEKANKLCIALEWNSPDRPTPLMNFNIGIDNTYLDGGTRKNMSFSEGLVYTNQIKENKSFRIKVGLTSFHIAEHREVVSGTKTIDDVDFKQEIINIAPGFLISKRLGILNFYSGIGLSTLFYTKLKTFQENTQEDVQSSSIIFHSSITGTADGGFAIGPEVFAGFNLFITSKISIGGAFSLALLYSSVGGNVNEIFAQTIPSNQTITTLSQQKIINIDMPRAMGSITFSYHF